MVISVGEYLISLNQDVIILKSIEYNWYGMSLGFCHSRNESVAMLWLWIRYFCQSLCRDRLCISTDSHVYSTHNLQCSHLAYGWKATTVYKGYWAFIPLF